MTDLSDLPRFEDGPLPSSGLRYLATTAELCEAVGITRSQLRYAIRSRGVPATEQRGREYRFDREGQAAVLLAIKETCSDPRWRNEPALRRIARLRELIRSDHEREIRETLPYYFRRAEEQRIIAEHREEIEEEVERAVALELRLLPYQGRSHEIEARHRAQAENDAPRRDAGLTDEAEDGAPRRAGGFDGAEIKVPPEEDER